MKLVLWVQFNYEWWQNTTIACFHHVSIYFFVHFFCRRVSENVLRKLQIVFYERIPLTTTKKPNNLFSYFFVLFSLFVWNRRNWICSKWAGWREKKIEANGRNNTKILRTHIHSVGQKRSVQVYVNAHLYCTKIRWNELLMKLKYISDKKLSLFDTKWNQDKASTFATTWEKEKHLSVKPIWTDESKAQEKKTHRTRKKWWMREWVNSMSAVENWWNSEIDRKLLWRSQSNNNQL